MVRRINNNTIFLTFVAVAFFVVIWLAAAGNEQNSQFLSEYSGFTQAVELMRQGEFAQAQTIFGSLLAKYDDNYQLNYYYGVCLEEQSKHREAARYLVKAQKLRPALVLEQGYLFMYGKALYNLDDREAERYLRGSIKYGSNKEMKKTSQQMIDKIHAKNSVGG